MVSHEGANQNELLILRQSRGRVVDRLVEPISAQRTFFLEPTQVFHGRPRTNFRGQHRCVRRDYQILDQSALQTQTGHAKWSILVIQVKVANVVSRFGNSPGHASFLSIFDLASDNCTIGFVEKGAAVIAHNEERHQILKHGAGPRDQRASAVHGRKLPPQAKPVFLLHITFRDGHKAREPRFRGQQIVVGIVRAQSRDVVANGKYFPFRIEEKVEVHLFHDLFRGLGETAKP